MTELSVPVISASGYTVSAELWQQLEDEIKLVSDRIEAGEDMVPEDVAKVRSLKSQVDAYVTSFNKAARDAQAKYRRLIDERLAELGFPKVEAFIAKKREEQTRTTNERITVKMDTLRNLTEGLLSRTVKLKDTSLAQELLPAFAARFPKVQSGAKNAEIKNWTPYYQIVSHTITVLDMFFQEPIYADAVLLPLHSGTMRELLAYVKDGGAAHLTKILDIYEADAPLLRVEKLKRSLHGKEDGLRHIASVLKGLGDLETAGEPQKQRAWEEIALVVRLVQ